MNFTPSPLQSAVFDAVQNTNNSLIIEAVAGSGKTTTIVHAANLIPTTKRTTFLAFNKSIATELEERLPSHVKAMTMNSLGHRAWVKYMKSAQVKLDKSKTHKIMDTPKIQSQFDLKDIRRLRYSIAKMVGYAKTVGLVPNIKGLSLQVLTEDTDENWRFLINHFCIDMGVDRTGKSKSQISVEIGNNIKIAIEIARAVLIESIKFKQNIDFDDQLYLPVIYGVQFPLNDVLFVDEAQDISGIQRIMLEKSLRANGRLIAVGDPNQAIYGFRGADSESLNRIADEFDAVRLPLSISYRCPKRIVKEAQEYVNHIQAHDAAIEGEIQEMGSYSSTDVSMFQKGDFVLCRNIAPLVKLAFTLIRHRRPSGILGRSLGKTIVTLVKKLKANSLEDLKLKLVEWEAMEIERVLSNDPEANIGYIKDRAATVDMFIRESGESTVQGVIDAINDLFDDEIEGAIVLSTIHKAKGLEADRVIILDRHLMPSKFARLKWQHEQENNLKYVAVTRSMNFLGYIDSPE